MPADFPQLRDFLLARIAEDEDRLVHEFDCERFNVRDYGTRQGECDCRATDHLNADCKSKRQIVERHAQKMGANLPRHPICAECGGADWRPEGGVLQPFPWVMPWPCHTLRFLALPYADHPDYQQEWRP